MQTNYTALIIDDEPKARMLLCALLKEYAPDIQVFEECKDLPNGVKAIRKHKPDLIFLDIEMPGHSGLELFDFFDPAEINFDIIFTTAYNNYASQAFKMAAIDYLLKPIEIAELETAINRFRNKSQKTAPDYNLLKEIVAKPSNSERIAVPSGNNIVFIEVADIVCLQADGSYTEIMFEDGKKMTVSRTLKNFEEALKEHPYLFRCHKSHIVNINFIAQYVKSDGGYIVMKNGGTVPISSEKSNELMENIKMIKR